MTHGRTPLAFTEDGGLGRDMNPDVVSAIARLRRDNVLGQAQATLFDRVARRRLVSVRFEIRALLYAGVLLLTSGVGLLVKEHRQDIGPWAVAGGIALAAAACLVWVIRKAAAFSWGAVPSPNVAFDYVLLLGLLLFASDLAYVEVEFALLGPKWPHHLLVVGVVYLLGAYLWDSRTILGLALTTLAAWRGVSASLIRGSLGVGDAGRLGAGRRGARGRAGLAADRGHRRADRAGDPGGLPGSVHHAVRGVAGADGLHGRRRHSLHLWRTLAWVPTRPDGAPSPDVPVCRRVPRRDRGAGSVTTVREAGRGRSDIAPWSGVSPRRLRPLPAGNGEPAGRRRHRRRPPRERSRV